MASRIKKCTKESNLRPDYILKSGKKKSMLIGDGSTAIRVFNSKIYHTIIVLKETDPHAEMDMDTHTLSPHTSL